MSIKRYAARRDNNERAIVDALEGVGATVVSISENGVPDLLVGWRGETYLIEVKGKRGKLTPPQEAFIGGWDGSPVRVVRSVNEALQAIGAIS